MKGLSKPEQKAPLARKPRGDILIVDDDPDMRALLRSRLASAGYDVRTAEDAVEAGHRVVERAPELIIIDIRMPYMSGFEFVAALRGDATLPPIAIVYVTAHEPNPEIIEKAAGAPVLQKPVPADRLFETVERELAFNDS
jgi:CheY-like chemotaxis protein